MKNQIEKGFLYLDMLILGIFFISIILLMRDSYLMGLEGDPSPKGRYFWFVFRDAIFLAPTIFWFALRYLRAKSRDSKDAFGMF